MRHINNVLTVFILIFVLFPSQVKADKHDDSKKILLLQKELEHSEYHGSSDSLNMIKISQFKNLLDNFINQYPPNKPYVRGALHYAKYIAKSNPHESMLLLHSLNKICNQMGYDSLRAFISHDIGSVFFQNGLITEALTLFSESAEYFNKIGDNAAYAYALNDIGNVYFWNNQYQEAKDYYHKAENIFQELNNPHDKAWGLALINSNYGEIYFRQEEFDTAEYFYKKAFNIRKSNEMKNIYYISYSAISSCFAAKKQMDSAFYYSQKAININKELGLVDELAFSYYNYAKILLIIDTTKAISYLYKSASVNKGKGITNLLRAYSKLSRLYFSRDIDSSLYFAKLIYNEAEKINNRHYLNVSTNYLVDIYHKLGNYKEEAHYFAIKVSQKEAINKNEIFKTELRLEGDNWKKEKELFETKERKNKIISYFQSAIAVLILGFSIFLILGRIKLKKYAKQLNETNNQLTELNKNRDTIYSIIAHDLRSPVGSSLSLIELMEEEHDKDSYNLILPTIRRTLKGTYNLLENLLSWAQLKGHSIKLSFKEINLKTIAKDTKNILSETANTKKIDIILQIDENINVYADPNSISTVLRNLISNAIKFSHMNGEIIIESKDKGDNIEISIKDFGIGMSEKATKQAFDEDVMITTAGTKNERGSGLGLKLCKEFIFLNKGKIWVNSKEGKGSTFYLILPKP